MHAHVTGLTVQWTAWVKPIFATNFTGKIFVVPLGARTIQYKANCILIGESNAATGGKVGVSRLREARQPPSHSYTTMKQKKYIDDISRNILRFHHDVGAVDVGVEDCGVAWAAPGPPLLPTDVSADAGRRAADVTAHRTLSHSYTGITGK